MNGTIAGPSVFSLELVGLVIGISMIVGAIDLIRLPGWAWKRAEESKIAYLVLVVFLPLAGLAMYVFSARPKVAAVAGGGRAASLPFERFGVERSRSNARSNARTAGPSVTVRHPTGFGSFGAATPSRRGLAIGASDEGGGGVVAWPRSKRRPPSSATVGPPPDPTPRWDWPGPTAPANGPACPRPTRPADRPGRMEGRPHRPPPVPLLERIPVDRERRRCREQSRDSASS